MVKRYPSVQAAILAHAGSISVPDTAVARILASHSAPMQAKIAGDTLRVLRWMQRQPIILA
jgi:hypothetical protein